MPPSRRSPKLSSLPSLLPAPPMNGGESGSSCFGSAGARAWSRTLPRAVLVAIQGGSDEWLIDASMGDISTWTSNWPTNLSTAETFSGLHISIVFSHLILAAVRGVKDAVAWCANGSGDSVAVHAVLSNAKLAACLDSIGAIVFEWTDLDRPSPAKASS
nr:hypothetical protein CFP56_31642 [Quercus suber]